MANLNLINARYVLFANKTAIPGWPQIQVSKLISSSSLRYTLIFTRSLPVCGYNTKHTGAVTDNNMHAVKLLVVKVSL